VRDDFEFVQGAGSLLFNLGFCVGIAALAAPAVNDDAGTITVRTQDAIIKLKRIFLFHLFLVFFGKRRAAIHAVMTFGRDMSAAGRARLSYDFLVTMWTFNHGINFYWMFSLEMV
jgi:hypothetical protein